MKRRAAGFTLIEVMLATVLLAGGLDEAGLPLGDDDVAEQLLLLLFAGYETTASALSTSISQARGLGEDFQNIEWNLMEKAGDIAPLEGSSAGKLGKSGKLRTTGKVRL